jgi:hypothetical protein
LDSFDLIEFLQSAYVRAQKIIRFEEKLPPTADAKSRKMTSRNGTVRAASSQWTLAMVYLSIVALYFVSGVESFAVFPATNIGQRNTCRRRPSLRQLASTTVNDTTTEELPMTETHLPVPMEEEEDDFDLPAKTLDGRLLCASQCAYNASSPYFEGAGYLSGSTTIQLTRGVNSVFIGETVDGIVLAFRGTRTKSPLDWLQNAALFLQRVNGVPGRIHTGFYRAVKSLWEPMKSTLLEMMETSNCTKVLLTGHSKGGAMASITAILMNRDTDLPNATEVVTFASAKPGDSGFVKAFNREINQTSYEYYLDIVPFLPPSQDTMDAMGEAGTEMMEGCVIRDCFTVVCYSTGPSLIALFKLFFFIGRQCALE